MITKEECGGLKGKFDVVSRSKIGCKECSSLKWYGTKFLTKKEGWV